MSIETPASVLRKFGLRLEGEPVDDGRIRRVPHDCRPGRDDAGWYVFHSHPVPHLAFGCWRCSPESHHWSGKTGELSASQHAELSRISQLRKKAIEAERHAVADRIRERLAELPPANPRHAYLVRKRVLPFQALQSEDCLILPLEDADGTLWSAQRIAPTKRADWGDRDKSFERGGRVAGCFHRIGKFDGAERAVVCEGFATGATIAEVVRLPVACAMNCGNLEPVVASLTERLRQTEIVVAADNDRHTPGNPGLTEAREVARKYNCLLAIPDFSDLDSSRDLTDFNDLRRVRGDEAVRIAISDAGTSQRQDCDRLGRLTVPLPDSISVEMPHFLDRLALALRDANERRGSPRYLCRGDAMALLVGHGRASRLRVADEHLLRAELQRDVHFIRQIRDGEGAVKDMLTGVLPQHLARDIAKTPGVAMGLPTVDGVAGCPIMDRSGTVTRTGYAPSLRLVCACDPWELDEPSLMEARQRLLALLADYRFVSLADQARALAALIQPALVMGEHVERGPVMLVVADQPGTGKGTIVAQRCAIYGAIATVITMRDRGGVGSLDEDLSSQLISGSLFLNIDNARGAIRSQVFEAALTESQISVRAPFRPAMCVDPRKVSVSLTSNGVSLTPDLALRCNIVRLRKQPVGYRFKSVRPVASTVAERARLLSAIFTIVADWVRRGSRRVEADYDGHARDFWCVVDEIIPRVFGLPRPTDGLKSAALAGADALLDLLRSVALILRAREEIPSQPLTAVQLLRIAGDEGIEYDGRMIPIEREEALMSPEASAFGSRYDARLRAASQRRTAARLRRGPRRKNRKPCR
jgi:phage/plasmid primase-like uncharacterized protein